MGNNILAIETSTAALSVALRTCSGSDILLQSNERNSHASLTAVFIDKALREAGLKPSELSCVAVSSGPGSYTGLRVGVSSAKGLCFGAGVPLVAVPTPDILAAMAPDGFDYIITMTDARRMEVYSAVYAKDRSRIEDTKAVIVEAGSYSHLSGSKCFIGDGALKCQAVLCPDGIHDLCGNPCTFIGTGASAAAMLDLAEKRLEAGLVEDTAYFEPFYLKDFVVTESKKKLWWLRVYQNVVLAT